MTTLLDPGAGGGNGLTALFVILLVVVNLLPYALNENSWLNNALGLPGLLCISNRRKFSDRYPGSYWAWETLDPRHLAQSYWVGKTGVFLVRVGVLVYFTATLIVDGVTGKSFQGAQWMVYFDNWSLCLIAVSGGLGVLVSLRHLAITYQEDRMIIHGRPGQRFSRVSPTRHRRTGSGLGAAAAACFAPSRTTGDAEEVTQAHPAQLGPSQGGTHRRSHSGLGSSDGGLEEALAQPEGDLDLPGSAGGPASLHAPSASQQAASSGPELQSPLQQAPQEQPQLQQASSGMQGGRLITGTRPTMADPQGPSESVVADVPPSVDSRVVAAAYSADEVGSAPGDGDQQPSSSAQQQQQGWAQQAPADLWAQPPGDDSICNGQAVLWQGPRPGLWRHTLGRLEVGSAPPAAAMRRRYGKDPVPAEAQPLLSPRSSGDSDVMGTATRAIAPAPGAVGPMQSVPEDVLLPHVSGDSRRMRRGISDIPEHRSKQAMDAVRVRGRGHIRTPSDLEAMRPAELRYAPTLTFWGPLEKVHCLAVQTAAATATLVCIYYWPFIYKQGRVPAYPADYLKHAGNVLVMLLDVWCSRAMIVSYHFQVCIWYGTVYIFFVWIYFASGHRWIYSALDWHQDRSIGFYMLIPVVWAGLFYCWMLFAVIRDWAGARCGSHSWRTSEVRMLPQHAPDAPAAQRGVDGLTATSQELSDGADLNWRFKQCSPSKGSGASPVVADGTAAAAAPALQDMTVPEHVPVVHSMP